MTSLLSVEEAVARILAFVTPLPGERVPLLSALQRVLADDVESPVALPPFANSSMDGYAVRADDVQTASLDNPAQLRVVLDIPAGSVPDRALARGEAARIMTGAPLPEGADAVVPVEQTDQGWRSGEGTALAEMVAVLQGVKRGDYVRPVGEDVQIGQVVLTAGTVIRAQELGVLAGIGVARPLVVRRPRVAILSSGDELAGVDEPLEPGQIRDMNTYTLFGLIDAFGAECVYMARARDTLDEVRRCFLDALAEQPDIIISSAGVSVGTADMVRTVLDELGSVDFWRVNVRPGKPLAFGLLGGVPFFGLPGNPVSAMVTFDLFVGPALLKLLGRKEVFPTVEAVVGEDLRSDGRRSFLRVRLTRQDGRYVATTTGTQSSGALMSMVQADGLLIIPENVTEVSAGETLSVRLLR